MTWLYSREVLRVVCVMGGLAHEAHADDRDLFVPVDPSAAPGDVEPLAPPFGTPGEVAISGTSDLSANYSTYGGSQATQLSLSFAPAIDVFVARNLSLGLSAGLSYGDDRGYGADDSLVETTTTGVSAAVRVGVDLPIASSLSLWPRLQVGFEWERQREGTLNGSTTSIASSPLGFATTTREGPWLELVLPLTLHVAPHLFASFGPSIYHEFASAQGGPDIGGERTTLGAFLDIGGWFGGTRTTEPGDIRQVVPVRPSGSRWDVVLSAFALQGFRTSYQNSASNDTSIAVIPAVDVFVADHISVGLTAATTYDGERGIDPSTGARVTFSHTTYGIAPRIGADLPIGRYASLWPSFSVGVGKGSYVEDEATSSNDSSESYVFISLYAPLLVHPVSHFFVGFGPSVSHDITRSETFSSSRRTTQNRQTIVGAGLTIGGVI